MLLETRKQCGNNAERGGIKKHSSNSGLYLQQAKCQNTVLFFHFGLSFQILGGNSPNDTVYRHPCNIVHIGVDLLKNSKITALISHRKRVLAIVHVSFVYNETEE